MNVDGRFMTVCNALLTSEECTNLIQLLDNETLEHVERGDMASYDRNIWIHEGFADEIYKRIQPILPQNTVRCNEYFRFSKYFPGQEFKLHTDGTNQDKFRNRSKYTVNIFLNDNFTGGETDFYANGQLAVRAIPQSGRAVIFDREITHCGNKVLTGNKYLDRRALETGTLWVPISNFLGLKTVRRIFNPAQSAGLKCPRV